MSIDDVSPDNLRDVAGDTDSLIAKLTAQKKLIARTIADLDVVAAAPPEISDEAGTSKTVLLASLNKSLDQVTTQIEHLGTEAKRLRGGADGLEQADEAGTADAEGIDPGDLPDQSGDQPAPIPA